MMEEVLARVKENITFVYNPEDKVKLDKSYYERKWSIKEKG